MLRYAAPVYIDTSLHAINFGSNSPFDLLCTTCSTPWLRSRETRKATQRKFLSKRWSRRVDGRSACRSADSHRACWVSPASRDYRACRGCDPGGELWTPPSRCTSVRRPPCSRLWCATRKDKHCGQYCIFRLQRKEQRWWWWWLKHAIESIQ